MFETTETKTDPVRVLPPPLLSIHHSPQTCSPNKTSKNLTGKSWIENRHSLRLQIVCGGSTCIWNLERDWQRRHVCDLSKISSRLLFKRLRSLDGDFTHMECYWQRRDLQPCDRHQIARQGPNQKRKNGGSNGHIEITWKLEIHQHTREKWCHWFGCIAPHGVFQNDVGQRPSGWIWNHVPVATRKSVPVEKSSKI